MYGYWLYQEETPDRLTRHVWRFWYDNREHRLVLDEHSVETRPTRRHGYRRDRSYFRLGHQRRMGEAVIPTPEVPAHVRQHICEQFLEALRVG